jgi:putative transposase
MKGKRYTTEDKIRILREADGGKAISEVCREHNISEVSFHRWKRQLGQLDVSEARRLKELERENSELKKMLAESLLKNRVLEAVCEKNSKPGATAADGKESGRGRVVLWSGGVPHSAIIPFDLLVSRTATDAGRGAVKKTAARTVGATSTVWVSADRGVIERGRLAGGQTTDSTTATVGGTAGAADEEEGDSARDFNRIAHSSDAPWACLDVGLHRGCDRAWGSLADADDPG